MPLWRVPSPGAGQEYGMGGDLCAAGPDLLSLDAPAPVDLGGLGAQRGKVGTGIGFGEKLAPDVLAGEDGPQVALLLGRGAEVGDGGAGEILPDGVEPLRGAGPVALLTEDVAQPFIRALAAVLLLPGQARIAPLVQHALPEAPERRLVLQIGRLRPGQLRKLHGEPGAQLVAEPCFRRCFFEIHRGPSVLVFVNYTIGQTK